MPSNISTTPYATYADIEGLIGSAVESNDLEFKRGDELDAFDQSKSRDELVRDVSAFANAGGGTIIYGIEETKGRAPTAGSIFPVKNDKATELRLTQIIRTGLEPVFNDFHVHSIEVPSGGRIIVITVERAGTAHQCKSDLKYYHRVGQHRPAMYDYEIRDVMNRRTAPIVIASCRVSTILRSADRHVYGLTPKLTNEGGLTAKIWALEVIFPQGGAAETQYAGIIVDKPKVAGFPRHRVLQYSSARVPPVTTGALLPGESLELSQGNGFASIPVTVMTESYHGLEREAAPVVLRLYVDDCRMVETIIPFAEWCSF